MPSLCKTVWARGLFHAFFSFLSLRAVQAAPKVPSISPIFDAHGHVTLREGKIHHLEGQGRWAINTNGTLTPGRGGSGIGVEDYVFPGDIRSFALERYDIGRLRD